MWASMSRKEKDLWELRELQLNPEHAEGWAFDEQAEALALSQPERRRTL
jgi:hypothetical protein